MHFHASRWFVLFIAVFFALGTASCDKFSKKEKSSKDSDKASDAAPASKNAPQANAPQVRVEDAGTGEKAALRYQIKAGQETTARMDMKMSMKMQMGAGQEVAVDMPTMTMKMKIHSVEVLSSGNFRYDFTFDTVEIGEDAALPPAAIDQLKGSLQGFVGTKGQAEVTTRGITVKAEVKAPENINPQIRQMMDSLQQQINQISVPFPEEPVGAGARWTVTMKMETGGISITNIYHYTLEKMENGVLEIKVSLEQKAEPQEIKNPALPPGTVVKLTEMQSSGSGRIVSNLSHLVPESEMTSTLNMKMHIQAGAQEQDMTQGMTIGIKMHAENP